MSNRIHPITGADKLIIDEEGAVVGFLPDARTPKSFFPRLSLDPITGAVTGLKGPTGSEFLVVSPDAPDDADGRPDGTIYIQTAA